MNNQTAQLLKAHFDIAFTAPQGIQKLRELILTLAMQGKLVPQDPNDPPARELLKEIENYALSLLKTRKVSYREISPNSEILAMQYPIPPKWDWMPFKDVVFFQEGPGIRNWQFTTSGIKLLNVSNILVNNTLDISNSDKYVSNLEFETKYKHFEIENGDLLFAGSGASWGKTAWYKDTGQRVMLNTSTMRLRFFHDKFAPRYLYYFVKSKCFKQQLEIQLVGLQPNFGSTHFCRLYIPLPPLPEQHRIVAKIDQLMALCDELEKLKKEQEAKRLSVHASAIKGLLEQNDNSAWDFIKNHFSELYSVKENIAELRKAILQLAVMGKLVPQDPNDPPARELLKDIEAEKQNLIQSGKIKKPKPLPPIKQEEIPYELPKGWEWVRLGEIGIINPRNDLDDSSITGFVPMPLIPSGYSEKHSFEERIWGEIKKSYTHFANGDIGMAKITPCFENAKSCVFANLPNGIGAGTTELHIFRNSFNAVFPRYLLYYLKNPQYIMDAIQNMTGSAGQKRVPTPYFIERPFPLPPLPEQHRIVAKIDQLMALCGELEQTIESARNKQEDCLKSIMAQV
ncbi:MAG: restriction endonuclease subunit S [Candidatus Cloacimonetes bacterium]|nr:restriction endonuclease subunit S [Candidatus Cloacimonadota bacterium]